MDAQKIDLAGAGRQRMINYDILRIVACFSVVLLHSSAQFWYDYPVTDARWLTANSYNALSRFGVPIFMMISGALFLSPNKKLDMKRLYGHNILRMVILYVVWSCFYGLFDCRSFDWNALTARDVLWEIYSNRYHLWFLTALIGIYILLPILKVWLEAARKRDVEYFLVLFLIFQVGKSTLQALKASDTMTFLWGIAQPEMVCSYLGYFILGYYIVCYGVPVKWRKWLYAGGIIGELANVVLGNYLSLRRGTALGEIYDSYGVFTFLVSVALFVFFTQTLGGVHYSKPCATLVGEVSKATLGIYLVHIALLEWLQPRGIHSMMFAPVLCVPLFALFVFFVCYCLAAVLRRIPVVGRYIC